MCVITWWAKSFKYLIFAKSSGNVLGWLESMNSEPSHWVSNGQSALMRITAHLVEADFTTFGALCHYFGRNLGI